MKNVFLNFVLLSFLLGAAFHLAKGADLNHGGICDTDLECYTMPSCTRGNGYCDQKDGKCKCPKLQAVETKKHTNGADLNHGGICDTDLECYTMPSCTRGNGYCDQKDGKCKCPKLQEVETKKYTNGADLNHGGICDTDLECYTMPSCTRGNGYCDQKDGKCKCPKLQAVETKKHTNGVNLNHGGICDTDLECYTMRGCTRGNGYCDQKDGKCKCPKLQAAEMKKHTNGVDVNHGGICDTDLECYTMRGCTRGNGYCDQKDGKCKCPK